MRHDPEAVGVRLLVGLLSVAKRLDQGVTWLLIGLIRIYKWTLSPWLGQQCRFYPTCSHYAISALEIHGAVRGSWLTIRRLAKCHPLHTGGVDEVPNTKHVHGHKHGHAATAGGGEV